MSEPVKVPPLYLFLTDFIRAWIEWIKSFFFRRKYQPAVMGDGHPILCIPGILGHDINMDPMRRFLQRVGYTPYPWKLGINFGNIEELDILAARIDELYEKHGEKLTLIGWSLGGIYARELAKQKSDKIRQVITVGAPFLGIDRHNRAVWVFRLLKGDIKDVVDGEWLNTLKNPPPVLSTALYSKKDGIVPWQYCKEPHPTVLHRNREVVSSHSGMPHNRQVLRTIAEVLPIQ